MSGRRAIHLSTDPVTARLTVAVAIYLSDRIGLLIPFLPFHYAALPSFPVSHIIAPIPSYFTSIMSICYETVHPFFILVAIRVFDLLEHL